MSQAVSHSSDMIQLSESAIHEVLRLKAKRKNPDLLLRLGIQFNGCLGVSYSIGFDKMAQPDDQVCVCDDLHIVVDPQSLPYLNGLVVDYSEDLMGGGFRFHNPQAAQSCGCGNSFSVSR